VPEVFAGFVMGYAISLAVAPLGAWRLISTNDRSGFAQRMAPPGTNFVALSVVVHLAAVLLLTAIGMILGLMLGGLEERRPNGGLGSPNLVFTLIVVALTAVVIIPLLILPAVRRYVVISGGIFAALFGWAMPWLATVGD
jgi:hypothetical protein